MHDLVSIMSLVRTECKPRIRVDKTLVVEDYRTMLVAMCGAVGTRDLWGASKLLRSDSWSSAPNLKRLMETQVFVDVAVDYLVNGLASHPLLAKALKLEHQHIISGVLRPMAGSHVVLGRKRPSSDLLKLCADYKKI